MESESFISNMIGALGFVLTFGVAIFVHELGHYLAARLRGVGVEAFAIGMGPKIIAWNRGGTEYSLRWLPVGGFVKLHQMVREEAEEAEREAAMREEAGDQHETGRSIGEAAHEDMAALYDKGLFTKLLVFGAGVFFNFLAAIAAMAMIYNIGFDEPLPGPAWIGEVETGTPLAEAGLMRGDYIMDIEGTPIADRGEAMRAFERTIENGSGEEGVAVKVQRQDETVALMLPPLTEATVETFFKGWHWDSKPYIIGVLPLRPAAKAGIREGDLVVSLNGQPVEAWSEIASVIRGNLDEALQIEVVREGSAEPVLITVIPEEDPGQPGTGVIGVVFGSGDTEHFQEPFLTALAQAPGRTWSQLGRLAYLNYDFIRRASFNEIKANVSGPLAIASVTFKESKRGLIPALRWFITLNLLLAIMNLLPIPVLDGGFIVLSVIEAVIRRPVPTAILNPVYTVCALGFITLFVLITYQDFLRLIF